MLRCTLAIYSVLIISFYLVFCFGVADILERSYPHQLVDGAGLLSYFGTTWTKKLAGELGPINKQVNFHQCPQSAAK